MNDTKVLPLVSGRIEGGPGLDVRASSRIPGLTATRQGERLVTDATPEPTSLYRYYDQRGVLLYVGITGRGMMRNAEHNKTQPWWPYVASQDVQHFADRPAALKAEKNAIQRHRPPFNKQHNPDKGVLADTYMGLRELEKPGRSPGVVMAENDGRLRMEIVSRDGKFLQCRAIKEDLELAAAVNFASANFNSYKLPGMGLVGRVVSWERHGYLAAVNLKAGWFHRVDGVNALVDSKQQRGRFIRTFEFRIDGDWIAAKPQRFENPNLASNNQIGRP